MKKRIVYNILGFILIFLILPFLVVKVSGSLNSLNKKTENKNSNGVYLDNKEFKGIWFSFLEWQKHHNGKNKQEWTNLVKNEIVSNLKSLKINNIFVHAVSHSDAYYKTDLYPTSKAIAKEYGKNIDYDPFKIFVDILKENGFKVHAWINPLRAMTDSDFLKISNSYQTKKWFISQNKSDYYMKNKDGRYWLNPSNLEVREFIKKVAIEILEKYNNIDGLHIDDYFYPSGLKENTVLENDLKYYGKIKPDKNLEDWRRESITKLIKILYEVCLERKKIFGISPQGNMQNNFNNMFFDQEEVIKNGYLDYIMPQLYYGFENEICPFTSGFNNWKKLIIEKKPKEKNINFYVGLAAYKCGIPDDIYAKKGRKEWCEHNDILKRQVELIRKDNVCKGYTFFTYNSFFAPEKNLKQKIDEEKNNLLAIL